MKISWNFWGSVLPAVQLIVPDESPLYLDLIINIAKLIHKHEEYKPNMVTSAQRGSNGCP